MTAPTQPTDDVTWVVNVNLRRAGVIMLELPLAAERSRGHSSGSGLNGD